MAKCDVCGNEYEKVTTLKNLTGEERNYCDACLAAGVEPYQDLIDYGWIYEMFCESYQKRVILPTLQYNSKTVQQFNEEIRKTRGW